jgi:Dyp-type peroxidase family
MTTRARPRRHESRPTRSEQGRAASARRARDDCRLQEGIYFQGGEKPGRCFRLLLLRIQAGATRSQAKASITKVWEGVQKLRSDLVADFREPRLMAPPGTPEPPGPELTCLLGFGAPLFQRYAELERPQDVVGIEDQAAPFPMLGWVDRADRATGEADLALQFIAESELAVSRAVVETCMLIKNEALAVVALYGGFNREDRRSWLGFHDGISNIAPHRRREAIETKARAETRARALVPEEPAWMDGGTFMGFLRVAIDLETWRGLSRPEQEASVGRDRETGCPLMHITERSSRALEGCPGAHGPASREYRDPPLPDPDDLAQFSHVNRTNLNRGPRDDPHQAIADSDNRIFRQGYEFLECLPSGRLRLGLNFVSFQRKISCLTNILTRDRWLGDANFGGKQSPTLLRLIGGGYYAVPPMGGAFPGADIF